MPQGDATYLIVTNEGKIEEYGLNAVCTHLGCVVPWNNAENKFMCPCHGSQYNAQVCGGGGGGSAEEGPLCFAGCGARAASHAAAQPGVAP